MKSAPGPGAAALLALLALLVLLLLAWLATTAEVAVWPVRNTVEYRLWRWWWGRAGGPPATGVVGAGAAGRLQGTVRNAQGTPVAGARVLLAQWDGTAFDATSGADGGYVLEGVPAGAYVAVAGAAGYADAQLGDPWLPWRRVRVPAGGAARADAVLVPERPAAPGPAPVRLGAGGPGPAGALRVGAPQTLSCARPLPGRASRREVTLTGGGGRGPASASGAALLYTPAVGGAPAGGAPAGGAPAGGWPLLLTVYPGPAAGWECASLPLAAAGYAVLAVGPAYSFEPERDVDDLARWLWLARQGALPDVDAGRAAVMGGSYSGVHVQRLLRRPGDLQAVRAVVLLGAPSDLFDARRRFEDGTYVPPFGLDGALVALGFPHREPLRYWRYSGAYHVRRDQPPLALIHSRRDEVVPFQQSEALAGRLAAVGAPHRLHVFEAASHYLLSEDGDALAIYDLTLAFLGEHLAPPGG